MPHCCIASAPKRMSMGLFSSSLPIVGITIAFVDTLWPSIWATKSAALEVFLIVPPRADLKCLVRVAVSFSPGSSMTASEPSASNFGKWMALTAALLGWLFDGLEMGLFPLVARPALKELLASEEDVGRWIGVITALFLVGAATGG